MNSFILFFLFIFSIGCGSDQLSYIEPKTINETLDTDENPYEISFRIDRVGEMEYVLSVVLDLSHGSYILSPLTPGDFKGLFSLKLEENKHLTVSEEITEYPPSIEKMDPFGNGPMKVAEVKTTYQFRFKVKSKEEFEVKSSIQFVIEPKCTLEEIPFTLNYSNEELRIGGNC
jgi:hypothetical protein